VGQRLNMSEKPVDPIDSAINAARYIAERKRLGRTVRAMPIANAKQDDVEVLREAVRGVDSMFTVASRDGQLFVEVAEHQNG